LRTTRENTFQGAPIETERGRVRLSNKTRGAATKSGDYFETDEAFLPDQAHLNAPSVAHHAKDGSEPGIHEIHGFNGLAGFMEQLTTFHLEEFQLGEQQVGLAGGQRQEDFIVYGIPVWVR
jgi:hypothetical protein